MGRARGEQICLQAERGPARARPTCASIVDADADLIRERAEIVDRATDILERMLDDLVAVEPTDQKGQRDRARCGRPTTASTCRTAATTPNSCAEPARTRRSTRPSSAAIPISERIATFAGDNEMPACAPPCDLSR